jgi:flagellin-like protein
MGKMKANSKFVNGEEAVSAVIGVILMVAITVAIAATVYVYVSGMLPTSKGAPPSMSITQNGAISTYGGETRVNFSIDSASADAKWSDLKIQVGSVDYGIPTAVPTLQGSSFKSSGTPIKAGNTLYINTSTVAPNCDLVSGVVVKIIHVPSNSVVLQKTLY